MRDKSAELRETSVAPISRHDRAMRISNTKLRRTSRITRPWSSTSAASVVPNASQASCCRVSCDGVIVNASTFLKTIPRIRASAATSGYEGGVKPRRAVVNIGPPPLVLSDLLSRFSGLAKPSCCPSATRGHSGSCRPAELSNADRPHLTGPVQRWTDTRRRGCYALRRNTHTGETNQ